MIDNQPAREKCPPHRFRSAWRDEDEGVIFCTRCGEVRPLEGQSIGAPLIETITIRKDA